MIGTIANASTILVGSIIGSIVVAMYLPVFRLGQVV